MNENNLIQFSQRTKSEQREIAQKGGIASGIARRKRSNLRSIFNALLDAETSIEEEDVLDGENFVNFSLSKHYRRATHLERMCFSIFQKAEQGDSKAFQIIQNIIGEEPIV